MNPKKFGKLANHKQELWKLPLGEFIEKLYLKHFKKRCPDTVRSVEELAEGQKEKRETRRQKVSEKEEDAGTEPIRQQAAPEHKTKSAEKQ